MKLESPFQWIPSQWLWIVWLILVIATLAMGRHLQKLGADLDGMLTHGVLDLETPWSSERAAEIRNNLGDQGIKIAYDQTKADFVFLIFYPLAISLSCALLASNLPDKVGAIGMMIAWGVLFAGPLDAIENFCIFRLLSGVTSTPWPQISTVCAVIKFTLVAGGLGFNVVGLGLLLRVKYL